MNSRNHDYISMENIDPEFSPPLMDSDMREFLEVWERLDVLNEGKISLEQLEYLILHTHYADPLRPEAITSLLSRADLNKDGYLSKEEYLILVKNTKKSGKISQVLRSLTFLTIPKSGRNAKVRKYIDEYSCFPPPLFTIAITVAEISVFIYYGAIMGEPITAYGPTPMDSPLIYNPERRYEAWRFLTYMFIHSGWLHILSNSIMQLIMGTVLELVHKWYRVSIIYILGVIGGCLASSLATPTYYLAGASGGVYALEYAYIGNLIINWGEMSYPIVQAIAFGLISILDVAAALWNIHKNADGDLRVSNMAHLGGAIVGILLGVNVLRNLKKEPWEKYCWSLSFVILVLFFGSAIIFHIAAPWYFPQPDYSPL